MRIVRVMPATAVAVMSAAEPRQRWISPAFFDFWATKLNPLWTLDRPLARLMARAPASSDAVTLVLRPNRHWKGMRAGQHVNLGVEIDGRRLVRSYSPTALPGGLLAITVKAVEGGRVSRHLIENAAVGEVFALEPAFGELTLPPAPAPLLLLAGGSGITPMRALLRELQAQDWKREVTLLYWARQREQLCFIDELQALVQQQPRFGMRCLLTGDAESPAPRIDALPLDDFPLLAERQVLACGPAGFVDAARSRLQGRVAGFQAEAFTPPSSPISADEGEVQVALARSGKTLMLARGRSLLEGLEEHGLRPRHGCRMGICNSCACGRQSGTTRHVLTGDRDAEPGAQVRLCVSAPSTNLVLDL